MMLRPCHNHSTYLNPILWLAGITGMYFLYHVTTKSIKLQPMPATDCRKSERHFEQSEHLENTIIKLNTMIETIEEKLEKLEQPISHLNNAPLRSNKMSGTTSAL